jgi:small neutral amino acid transporter SnatA (MarC family)
MAAAEMPTVRRSPEWWLLAAAVAVAGVMQVAPLAIPAGVGVMVFAAILLGGKRPRRAGPLTGAIVVLSVSLVVIAALGFATSIAASTNDHGVTLIKG